jgi:hypothetical protein
MVMQSETLKELLKGISPGKSPLKQLNERYLRDYLFLTNSDMTTPYYGAITLIFERNEAERVKEERLRKL